MSQSKMTPMRLLTLLSVLIFGISIAAAQESDASLSETTEWLTNRLRRHECLIQLDREVRVSYDYEALRFDRCTMYLQYKRIIAHHSAPTKDDVLTFKLYFPLSEYDPASVSIKSYEATNSAEHTHYLISASLSSKNSTEWGYITTYKAGVLQGTENERLDRKWVRLFLYFNDKENAKRVSRALQHAIKLCGGKVQPF